MRSPSPTTPAYPAADIGLLLLRLTLGLPMAAHGTQKLFGWFDGPGLDATGESFEFFGYPSGRTMALIAGLSETFGGLALALGLLTPLAAAAVLGTMINAAVAVHWEGGFFAPEGIEMPLLYGLGAAALALTGPGRYAADTFVPVPARLASYRPALGPAALALAVVAATVVLLLRD
ncbi:DoxX family protein [Streptomyces specialis]|uniref:DoxX family protein n=1 Tax=Streptomyces specialis TaxID=498367 RepID=UPI00073E7DF5|nr:DoxX family protein [Streptomyces specialis]